MGDTSRGGACGKVGLGSAARIIRCGGGLVVGVEQQLYHLDRRALGGSVVQGQLLGLSTRRAAQYWSGRATSLGEKKRENAGA